MKKAIAFIALITLVFSCISMPVNALANTGDENDNTTIINGSLDGNENQNGNTDPLTPVNPDGPSNPDDPVNPEQPDTPPVEPVNPEPQPEPQPQPQIVKPTSIVFNKTELVMPVGSQDALALQYEPENAVFSGIFETSNPSVVSVDQSGVLTANSVGYASIYYTSDNGIIALCKVTVIKYAKKITLDKKSVNLLYDREIKKGFTEKLEYTLDKGAYDSVTFKSQNEKIATVSKNGVITPHKKGKTRIIVTAEGGAKAKCTVTVKDNCNRRYTLNKLANRAAMKRSTVTRIVYGTTVQGRPLEAYVIKGKKSIENKVLFADFACHGFEDSYAHDGKVLVEIGNKLVDYYSKHTEKLKNTTLVIVPCANPDGTIAGRNNQRACKSAFGRCTAAHVDMNRDFGRFRGKESRALKSLMNKYPPDTYLNFHGWLNTSLGTPWLAGRSTKMFGFGRVQPNAYGTGYIIGYVHRRYGASSCLVEYKSPRSARNSVGKTKSFINSLM